jgi:hypothetical protein
VRFQELYEQYHEKVQFLNIYIREAHPKDGWWLGLRLTKKLVRAFSPKVSMDYYDPQTIAERRAVAGDCEKALQYGIRTYVDEMDDKVNKAYAAWPTRLYLVGLDGRVVYAGGMGPYNYRPNELKAAIEDYLMEISHENRSI